MSHREIDSSPMVAVAIDKDKSSQNAFKWALDNVVTRGQTLTLVHVNTKGSSAGHEEDSNSFIIREIFSPFRCFCTRKDVQCNDVIVDEPDVAKAIIEFVSTTAVEKLVIGASPRGGFVRSFRSTDISSTIFKGVPDFCTVYVISKGGKVSSMKNAARPPPSFPIRCAPQIQGPAAVKPDPMVNNNKNMNRGPCFHEHALILESFLFSMLPSNRSPFTRGGRASTTKSYGEIMLESDISFVSSSRPSVERNYPPRLSNMSDSFERSFESPRNSLGAYQTGNGFSSSLSYESDSSHAMNDEVEAEIKRLKLELKQTMDMYSTACKEALTAKQKAMELQRWKMEEEKRLQEARFAEEAALALAEREKAKCLLAMQTAEASKRIAESETQKRYSAEMKAVKQAEEKNAASISLSHTNLRYRRYSIEEIEAATENFADNRKIGEGGYGPVYRCTLDHTAVAIKVLRPDAAHGRSQFQQEVEILCCIRHPNMVLLLGACPEYGCLVYEHMANGSLEDRLCRRGNTPPIPWQHRFRIAAEIGTGLLFLHQTKPEPLVHRDLKPANILLDRNYVSKISDVGLARLVPPSVANNVTQYRMTATAGTFCYIDPEYQQTGMLGIKSDIYSLGILLLQIVTGKPPMGLTHYVERSIEKGTFIEMLDHSVPDWPVEEALSLAKMALKCAELRRKDRPDLGTVILPELNRLREIAEDNLQQSFFGTSPYPSAIPSQVSSQGSCVTSSSPVVAIRSDRTRRWTTPSPTDDGGSPINWVGDRAPPALPPGDDAPGDEDEPGSDVAYGDDGNTDDSGRHCRVADPKA
ncbi:U-box domain-containing protein 52-like [Canna indica]|uniref:RING-type E3 ubiquitin transferase n=1 Tax=Canna indica TaxID=4628 RepID=A0AAQ3KYI9_9LILI|nr:U-box domain-containing protein 52-like [Canna indica]